MSDWVIVVENDDFPSPSVIGPFETAEKAAEYGKSLRGFVSEVKLSTLTPPPK